MKNMIGIRGKRDIFDVEKMDGEIYGNTQYVASFIGQHTGGGMFLIETEEKYPADYDT